MDFCSIAWVPGQAGTGRQAGCTSSEVVPKGCRPPTFKQEVLGRLWGGAASAAGRFQPAKPSLHRPGIRHKVDREGAEMRGEQRSPQPTEGRLAGISITSPWGLPLSQRTGGRRAW